MAHKSRGSALITALFIMALVAIVATAMSSRLRVDIYRTSLIEQSDRLYLASQAVRFWAMDRLADPKQPLIDAGPGGLVLVFPKTLQTMYPNITIQGELYDLQARFNLNNLTDKLYQPVFYGLLEHTLPNSDSQQRLFILEATKNWIIGSDAAKTGHDEWFDRYSKQKPVYFPSYQRMQHVSEFRTVFGIQASMYQILSPFLTALPKITPINLTTASKEIILSLGDGMRQQDAETLIKLRKKHVIKDLNELAPFTARFNIPKNEITLQSDYFLSVAHCTSQGIPFTNYTLLKRKKNKQGRFSVYILTESFNTI